MQFRCSARPLSEPLFPPLSVVEATHRHLRWLRAMRTREEETMQRTLVVAGTFLLLWAGGCSEDEPAAPESPTSGSETSVTISPAGGELRVEGLVLSVPPGAFSSTATLQLTPLAGETPFGAKSISATYRIDGFPTQFYSPLRVQIGHNGTARSGNFIAVGAPASSSTAEGIDLAYSFYAAQDSGGWCIGTVGPNAASMPSQTPSPSAGKYGIPHNETSSLTLTAITSHSVRDHQSPHYKIYYRHDLDGQLLVSLLAVFDEVCQTLKPALSHSAVPEYSIPVPVVVKSLGPGSTIYARWYHSFLALTGTIVINEDRLSEMSSAEMKKELGESLFFDLAYHACLAAPHNLFWVDSYFWFHVACALWSHGLFSAPGSVPARFPGHEYAPFTGFTPPSSGEANARLHGYGMSVFIEHLVRWSNPEVITKIYARLGEGQPLAQAITLAGGGLSSEAWWQTFFWAYLTGQLYPLDLLMVTEHIEEVFHITSAGDSLHEFTRQYRDLSAKMFLIDLAFDPNALPFDAETDLTLRVSPSRSTAYVHAFADTGGAFKSLGWANDNLALGNLIDLKVQGLSPILLVGISCQDDDPVSGIGAISLDARLGRTIDYNWNSASIGLYDFVAHMKSYVQGAESEYESRPNLVQEAEGWFEGSTFRGTMTDRASGGTFTITLDPDRLFVKEFGFHYTYNDGDNRGEFALAGRDVPLEHYWYGQQDKEVEFRLSADSIRSHVTECTMVWGNYTNDARYEMLDWDCDENSALKVKMYIVP